MTAKLFGGSSKGPVVEVRRSGRKPPSVVEVEAQPIPLEHGGDDAFVYVFKSAMPDGRRIPLKSIRGPHTNDPIAVIREYEAEGRVVKWIGKLPEEYFEE